MTVEARAGRTAPAGDRRDPRPAAHCYLFHVTPHPYESTRPGQGNPIAPVRHACIAVTGFTFPVRGLTITLRIQQIPGRVGRPAHSWAAPGPHRVRPSRRVTTRSGPGPQAIRGVSPSKSPRERGSAPGRIGRGGRARSPGDAPYPLRVTTARPLDAAATTTTPPSAPRPARTSGAAGTWAISRADCGPGGPTYSLPDRSDGGGGTGGAGARPEPGATSAATGGSGGEPSPPASSGKGGGENSSAPQSVEVSVAGARTHYSGERCPSRRAATARAGTPWW